MNDTLNYSEKKINKSSIMTICLGLYFILLPLGVVGIAGVGSALKLVALLPVLAFFINNTKIRLSRIILLQFSFTCLLLFSLLYSINTTSAMQRTITNGMFFVLLLCTGSIVYKNKEIEQLKKTLIWSSRITCLIILLFSEQTGDRILLRSFITEDPNYLNGYLLFGVAFAMERIVNETATKAKIMAVIEISVYLYTSILTGSRGGLLSILITMVAFFLVGSGNKGYKPIVNKVIFLFLFYFILLNIIKYVPEDILFRFQLDTIKNSDGSKRYQIWNNAFQIFETSSIGRKLFGYGAGSILQIYSNYGYIAIVAHNIIIEILMEGGVITAFIYILLIANCLIVTVKNKDIFTFVVLLGFITLSMGTSLYGFKPYWNAIIFSNLTSMNNKIRK